VKKFTVDEEAACDAAEVAIKDALDKHLPGSDRFAWRMMALIEVVADEFATVDCPGCRKRRLDGAITVLRGWVDHGEHIH
jgi:hypothetical protein